MSLLTKKENVGRILASKKDVLKAYRELIHARTYAGCYPKNSLAQLRLDQAEKAFAEVLVKNFGSCTQKATIRAEEALAAYLAARKKGIKIARDKLLWNLLAQMETGDFSLSEYDALDSRLSRYGFISRGRMERFLRAVNVQVKEV